MLARYAADGLRTDIERANPYLDTIFPSNEGMGRIQRQAARYATLRQFGS